MVESRLRNGRIQLVPPLACLSLHQPLHCYNNDLMLILAAFIMQTWALGSALAIGSNFFPRLFTLCFQCGSCRIPAQPGHDRHKTCLIEVQSKEAMKAMFIVHLWWRKQICKLMKGKEEEKHIFNWMSIIHFLWANECCLCMRLCVDVGSEPGEMKWGSESLHRLRLDPSFLGLLVPSANYICQWTKQFRLGKGVSEVTLKKINKK